MKRSNNRIRSGISDSADAIKSVPDAPLKKSFSRSPFREATRMIRVPVSLIPALRRSMEQRKAEIETLTRGTETKTSKVSWLVSATSNLGASIARLRHLNSRSCQEGL